MIREVCTKVVRVRRLRRFRSRWREQNPHNSTIPARVFPEDAVRVGSMTYGGLDVLTWGAEGELLTIGDCVSIGPGVKFILGGEHRHDTPSTYPFRVKLFGESVECFAKGPIEIADDVWIGMNAMILSGVRVGRGAVIAAGAVVARDIPAYAIVAGNPARVVKYRFSEDVREAASRLDLVAIARAFSPRDIALLYGKATVSLLETIRSKLQNTGESDGD